MDTTTSITIAPVAGTELHHQYPGQSGPQDVYVELDARDGALSASYNAEIGNAYPFCVAQGHVTRWGIPALRADDANALLAEIAPVAERVVAGYTRVWDGHNNVAQYSADAKAALEEIERLCEASLAEGSGELSIWTADEWYAPLGGLANQAEELGITATTTDEELAAIVAREEASAANADEIDEVTGIEKHLAALREHARDAS